jgi:beta-glucanase (GH16 family)
LFEQKYGRFEARIQIPQGQGMWPAFWLLGNNLGTVDWPSDGEIDVMENVGFAAAEIQGSLYGPGYFGASGISGTYKLPTGYFAAAFHIFAVEWEPNVVRFCVDGNLCETPPHRSPKGTGVGLRSPFLHDFELSH